MFSRAVNWVDVIIGLVLSFGLTFLDTLYGLCFWNWFISPLFPGVHMTYWWLLGLSMALSFIFGLSRKASKIDTEGDWKYTAYVLASTIAHTIVFGLGALVYAIAF